jgi:GNAT superfamily N-acetyltransferase
MEGINYRSPKESSEEELKQHRFELVIDNKKIGSAELDYFSRPIPLYQLTELYVDYEQKGKGYASQIMDTVEEWLRSRKKPGILADGIFEDDPAKGMYAKRGWKEYQV